jgi:5-methylcytosine-specific restriction endonuclease McrA
MLRLLSAEWRTICDYTKGYNPSPAEAQIDHIFPRSQGGSNSFGNAQVLSREENLTKGATTP